MRSFKKSLLFVVVKISAFCLMLMPLAWVLGVGRFLGVLGYFFLVKKRRVVYANLKTVFAATHTPAALRQMTRGVFMGFMCNVVEFLCLPKMMRCGLENYVHLEGKAHIDAAKARGKGVIFLAVHTGSWELASIVGGVVQGVYHIVANDHARQPLLDAWLNEYRALTQAHVITAGNAAKDIIRALSRNEIVSLVLDQGGKTGSVVPFLGKTASMSTGAIRLALKYGCAVCPIWIQRTNQGRHALRVFPEIVLTKTGDIKKDVLLNTVQALLHFETLLKEHPTEYMWFYKVFKYGLDKKAVIVDDGRIGHLRQSQALALNLKEVLKKKGMSLELSTFNLEWSTPRAADFFSIYVFLAQYLPFLKREDCLKHFLTSACFEQMMSMKADYVISCGSQAAGINYILSQNHLAKSIAILTPGLLAKKCFNVLVLPQHDKPKAVAGVSVIMPKVAPNLINPEYLKKQGQELTRHYSHLKDNVRLKFGVLIGGNTRGVMCDETQIRLLLSQIKEAAVHYKADILLTTSRRTPVGVEQLIAHAFKGFERCALCLIANQRNIPQAVGGILDLSDVVIVSGESISMVSEALSASKRTIVFSLHGQYNQKPRDKYEDFVLQLADQGYLMTTSVHDLKAKITQLLSRKITLKSLEDGQMIQKGLEAIV